MKDIKDRFVNTIKQLNSDIKGGLIPGVNEYAEIISISYCLLEYHGYLKEELVALLTEALGE
jgi:hypothetical protein